MRADPTDAEKRLWFLLRSRLPWAKFRRQVPIRAYIADFACHAAKLIVELDGGQHAGQQAYDVRRTSVLEADGYHVIRFWNLDVLTGGDAVIDTIAGVLDQKGFGAPAVGQPTGRGYRSGRVTPSRSG